MKRARDGYQLPIHNSNVAKHWNVRLSDPDPAAARLGVRIACENVGNGFGSGIAEWKEYLEAFRSPWIGAFFDIGNHDRFDGGAAAWIRALGTLVMKIDVRDHDHAAGKNCDLFEGNVDWPEVRAALREIGYHGWATAEVRGGGVEELTRVDRDMRKALGIGQKDRA